MTIYKEEEKYWIWLASLPGMGAKTFYRILAAYGSAADFFDAMAAGTVAKISLPPAVMTAAKAACSSARISEIMAGMASKHIRAYTRLCSGYPAALTDIPIPPPVLFIKGSLDGIKNAIGIVGTRGCTRRGYELARVIASELGVPVVSGMARGVDTAAHLGALDAGQPTAAVLGCGADVIYPPENETLYHSILENGAVISELPPGTGPMAANFPVRNRIIAGLCRGLLVVESGMEGGTAITASLAVGYGRDIFAVPGPPYLASAELPNELIAQGAVPVRSAADIRAYYGDRTHSPKEETQMPPLDFFQQRIYGLLMQDDYSAEDISQAVQGAPGEVSIALTMMELAGVCRRMPGGKYGI